MLQLISLDFQRFPVTLWRGAAFWTQRCYLLDRKFSRSLSSHACGRASIANSLFEMGIDMKTIMVAGDWRSIVVFMGTYAKGRTNAGRLVVERFGQYDFSAEL